MRVTAVSFCRNDGPFLLEWLAFHRTIGVTSFLVYAREPDESALLAALAAPGWLTALPAPADAAAALRDARGRPGGREGDWTLYLDPNEFLNVAAGDGSIGALVEASGGAEVISVATQVFATGDAVGYHDRPVIGAFTGTHNPDICGDRLALPVRSLVRSALPLLAPGLARPFLRVRRLNRGEIALPRWTDGSGRPVPRGFALAGPDDAADLLPASGGRALASVNRYPVRWLASWLARSARVEGERLILDDTPWREASDDAWQDTSIQRHLPAVEAEVAALKALPGVAEAHEACVARHRAAIADVEATDGYAELVERLLALPKVPPAELAVLKLLGVA